MVYTCAYFTDWNNSIDQAQADKLEHICRKLRLKPGGPAARHRLRLGRDADLCSEELWRDGRLAFRCRRRRPSWRGSGSRQEGLEDRISIHVKCYEEMEGQFDKISSIGMFEAVGIANHGTYFSNVERLLKPGGLYLHHAITRRMKRANACSGAKAPSTARSSNTSSPAASWTIWA